MRHPDDGIIRRLCDEPLAISAAERGHIANCARCAARLDEMRLTAERVGAMLSARAEPDTRAALARVQQRTAGQGFSTPRVRPARIFGRATAPLSGLAGAAALVAALAFTPAGSFAQTVLTVFQPSAVAEVPITTADLSTLPDLRRYGTVTFPKDTRPQTVSGPAEASRLIGAPVLAPGVVPPDVPHGVTYTVLPATTSTFTFSAAKAQAAARAAGRPAPAMPSSIDGSSLQLHTSPAVLATYGPKHEIPALVIGQTKAPVVSSTGVSVREIEEYVLSLPGVSPGLAASVRAIGDPAHTLPIPVPIDRATAQKVSIDGAPGLAVGDNTGVGSAVVWEKDGTIYGVAGTVSEDEVLSVARSLR